MSARLLAVLAMSAAFATAAEAQSALRSSVIAGGGTRATSTNFALHATAGQPAVGTSASAGFQGFHGYWFLPPGSTTGVGEELPDLRKLALAQYPNPFHPRTTIAFTLPRETHVRLRVYDARGAEVAVLADRRMTAGPHRLELDGRGLASGVYFYRLTTAEDEKSGRMVLLR